MIRMKTKLNTGEGSECYSHHHSSSCIITSPRCYQERTFGIVPAVIVIVLYTHVVVSIPGICGFFANLLIGNHRLNVWVCWRISRSPEPSIWLITALLVVAEPRNTARALIRSRYIPASILRSEDDLTAQQRSHRAGLYVRGYCR